jgi:hypothetical protein
MRASRLCFVLAALMAAGVLTACSAGEPGQPPAPTAGPSTSTPAASPSQSPTPTAGPTVEVGPTLRQLGFENGPLDELTLPAGAVLSTSVDQPNAVTIVLARPSPQTVEDYLRTTLPDEGFTVDQTAVAGSAMTFEGNGWKGGFTGTAATSAIVLRPA